MAVIDKLARPRKADRRTPSKAQGVPVSTPPPSTSPPLNAPRIVIEQLMPGVDGGRFSARATVNQWLRVEAVIFGDGHEALAAEVVWNDPGGVQSRHRMVHEGNDRWSVSIELQTCGIASFAIAAWVDGWATLRSDLAKKRDAGKIRELDIREAVEQVRGWALSHRKDVVLADRARTLAVADAGAALDVLLDEDQCAVIERVAPRTFETLPTEPMTVEIERSAAGFASWYELFPRSQGTGEAHGTFDDVISRLPAIAAMGFDVLYLPPIHPIGLTARKGRNNSLAAGAGEPGSPYAIGSADGGHDAIHPELGGIEAFRRLREAASMHGMELALDFAIQCSPDHPWLSLHPEWFNWRADGSLRCAENPPKTYEDIVNVNFYAEPPQPDLWIALRDVIDHWVNEGVRCFRVDNPHTKPLPFWEWLIADVRSRHPDVMFLSEAFTRPAMMYRLAKIGFSQSYTYFTWRDTKAELTTYLTELTQEAPSAFFRPHFFVNTPDINPRFLQTSGRPGFLIRAALASTLSGLWGLYSGFELCEAAPLPGREEYLDSEKYQLRSRDWAAPGNIVREITRLNAIRRQHPALQSHLGLRFHVADNPQVLFYGKSSPAQPGTILVAVSLDPHRPQEAFMQLPLDELGVADGDPLEVEELMSGQRFIWRGRRQHWYFEPRQLPFAIWNVRRVGST